MSYRNNREGTLLCSGLLPIILRGHLGLGLCRIVIKDKYLAGDLAGSKDRQFRVQKHRVYSGNMSKMRPDCEDSQVQA